jgi:hypothetical protein
MAEGMRIGVHAMNAEKQAQAQKDIAAENRAAQQAQRRAQQPQGGNEQ